MIPSVQKRPLVPLIHVAEPLQGGPQIQIARHSLGLADTGKGGLSNDLPRRQWSAAGLHAIEFPYLGCVVEGVADLRVATQLPRFDDAKGEFQVLTLEAGSWFLLPPGTLHPNATLPHWERPNLEAARSLICWFHVLPVGVLCHTCSTRGALHEPQPSVLVPDADLPVLVDLLFAEMKARRPHFQLLAHNHLLSMLLQIERALAQHRPALTLEDVQPALTPREVQTSGAALRACAFIEDHLRDTLTPEVIARQARVSVSHLNRLFRAELQTSPMGFLTQKRIALAQNLLENTDLPIGEIARTVGFAHVSHFNQTFARLCHQNPSAFRRAKRKSVKLKN